MYATFRISCHLRISCHPRPSIYMYYYNFFSACFLYKLLASLLQLLGEEASSWHGKAKRRRICSFAKDTCKAKTLRRYKRLSGEGKGNLLLPSCFVPFKAAEGLIIYPVSWRGHCHRVMGDDCSLQRRSRSETICIVGLCSKHSAPWDSTNDIKSMFIKHSRTTEILNSSVSWGSPYLCFSMGMWKTWNSRFILIHLHCDL